ncbi:hypothetical protein ACMFMG_011296 [Clarireedia jacksonii]
MAQPQRSPSDSAGARAPSPTSPQPVDVLVESPCSARRSSSATGMQAATPLSIIAENTRASTRSHCEAIDHVPIAPQNDQHSAASSVASVPLPSSAVRTLSTPFPDLELDWEMQLNHPYDLSFSLSDIGSLLPWMPHNDPISSSAGQGSLEMDIPPPPQFSSITGTSQLAHPRLPDTYSSGRRALSLFPQLQPSDHNVLNAENSAHVRPIPARIYEEMLSFFRLQQAAGFHCHAFPEKSVLDAFIQLYFEHFDPLMPFLHCSFLEEDDVHWILVLAVASVGSQYTAIERRSQYIVALLELLRRALPNDAITIMNYDMTMIAQSVLLCNTSLMWCGLRDYLVILEPQRAWLATLIQPLMNHSSSDFSFSRMPSLAPEEGSRDWQNWIRTEAQRRLPKLQAEDLDQQLPCDDAAWRAGSAFAWEAHCLSDTCMFVPVGKPNELISNQFGVGHNVASMNLRALFIEFCSSDVDLSQASEFTKLLLLFIFWVEERRAVKGSTALSLMHGNKTAAAPASISDKNLDAKFAKLQIIFPKSPSMGSSDEQMFRARRVHYHVLFILRHVPLKSLHSSLGWRASSSDAEKTKRSIVQWIQDNPAHARHCAFHAASAFCAIRGADYFNCSQPFCLLVAVEYLRIYQHGKIYDSPPTGPGCSKATQSSYQPSQGQGQGTAHVLRINPRQTDEDDVICKWISGEEAGLDIYLPGVGLLLQPLSPTCLLREFQRLLTARELTGWPIIRAGLRHSVEEILNEVTPLSQPPYSVDVEG